MPRYQCKVCGRGFSLATLLWTYYQKKRHINTTVRRLLLSNMSLSRTAALVGVNLKTIELRVQQLGAVCQEKNRETLEKAFNGKCATHVQFDEAETFEKTKLLPLSLPVVVTNQRIILGFDVCSMPPHPVYKDRSEAKYGVLPDDRIKSLRKLLVSLKSWISEFAEIKSDECPRYPWTVKKVFPGAQHKTFYARRAKPHGLGELKVGAFDPLFAINHTLAKLRANVSRLNRRTWNTTKRRDRLMSHLWIFIESHNRYILRGLRREGIPLALA